MDSYSRFLTDRHITLYTWGHIFVIRKSRQRALGAMAALYSGARIIIERPKVRTNRMKRKYK